MDYSLIMSVVVVATVGLLLFLLAYALLYDFIKTRLIYWWFKTLDEVYCGGQDEEEER